MYNNILIGINVFYEDWIQSLNKINEKHIQLIDFRCNENMEKIINTEKISLILPLSQKDYEIVKNKIYDNITILYPNQDIYELLNNKLLFTKYMIENFNEFIPITYYLDNIQLKELEFPVISKPIYSTNGTDMKIYKNENDFLNCNERIIIQKFIEDEYECESCVL